MTARIYCSKHQPPALGMEYVEINRVNFDEFDDHEYRVIVLGPVDIGPPMEVEEEQAVAIDWQNIDVDEAIVIEGDMLLLNEDIKIKHDGPGEYPPCPIQMLPCGCSADPNKPRYELAPGFHLGLKSEGDPIMDGLDQNVRRRFSKRLTPSQFEAMTENDILSANFSFRCKEDGLLYFTIEVNIATAVRVLMANADAPATTRRKPIRSAAM